MFIFRHYCYFNILLLLTIYYGSPDVLETIYKGSESGEDLGEIIEIKFVNTFMSMSMVY